MGSQAGQLKRAPEPTASAELRLLAAAVSHRKSADRLGPIRAAVQDPALDWEKVLLAVHRHRMAGFVSRALAEVGCRPPNSIARPLRDLAAADARNALVGAAEAVRLSRALTAADIPVLVLKGPVAASMIHGDLSVRQSKDIDLLIPPDRLAEAMQVCLDCGYGVVPPSPAPDDPDLTLWIRHMKDVSLRSRVTGVLVELHARPMMNAWLSSRLDLWRDQEPCKVGLGEMHVQAPSRDGIYAYLCVHGGSHAWARLKWLADIVVLTDGLSDEELVGLYRAAEARGAGRASALALRLISRLWSRSLPPALERETQPSRVLDRLEALSWRTLTDPRSAEEVPFRHREIQLSWLMLGQGLPHFLSEMSVWRYDWETVRALRLPRALWGLYPLLKLPVWIGRRMNLSGARA